MRTSRAGIALIKEFEGCRLTAYSCPAGVLTIGHPEVRPGMQISKEDASRILQSDLRMFEYGVLDNVVVPLEQHQFDALVSFAFNLGVGNLKKSTLLTRVNEGKFDAVPAELMKWTKSRVNGELKDLPGLVRRRRAEAALWRGIGDAPVGDPEESRITPAPPKPSKTMAESKEGNGAIVAGTGAVTGAIAAVTPVVEQAQQASGLVDMVIRLVESQRFYVLLIGLIGAGAAGGVWFWRRRRLREEGA